MLFPAMFSVLDRPCFFPLIPRGPYNIPARSHPPTFQKKLWLTSFSPHAECCLHGWFWPRVGHFYVTGTWVLWHWGNGPGRLVVVNWQFTCGFCVSLWSSGPYIIHLCSSSTKHTFVEWMRQWMDEKNRCVCLITDSVWRSQWILQNVFYCVK